MDAEKTSQVVRSLFGASSSRYESSKGGKLMSNAAPKKYKHKQICTNEHGNIFLAPCLQRVAKYMNHMYPKHTLGVAAASAWL